MAVVVTYYVETSTISSTSYIASVPTLIQTGGRKSSKATTYTNGPITLYAGDILGTVAGYASTSATEALVGDVYELNMFFNIAFASANTQTIIFNMFGSSIFWI